MSNTLRAIQQQQLCVSERERERRRLYWLSMAIPQYNDDGDNTTTAAAPLLAAYQNENKPFFCKSVRSHKVSLSPCCIDGWMVGWIDEFNKPLLYQ
jgi:hypothetical protein